MVDGGWWMVKTGAVLLFTIHHPLSTTHLLLRGRFRHVDQLAGTAAGAAAKFALARLGRRCRWGFRSNFFFCRRTAMQALATQADLAIRRIDAQDLDLDRVADLDDFLRGFNLVIGEFGDVQEALQTRLQLDEDAEVGELGHLARLDVARMVTAGNVALPRIALHLLEAQRHPFTLLIDIEDDALDLLPLADHLARMTDLAHPTHVADMQQAIN